MCLKQCDHACSVPLCAIFEGTHVCRILATVLEASLLIFGQLAENLPCGQLREESLLPLLSPPQETPRHHTYKSREWFTRDLHQAMSEIHQ